MSPVDLQFLSSLLQAVLLAVLPVLAGVAVRWVIAKVAVEKSKLSSEQLATLDWLAGIAVKAAEQANLAGYVSDKKKFALDFAEKWLAAQGVSIDLDLIDAAIEAAVYSEFNYQKSLPAPVADPAG